MLVCSGIQIVRTGESYGVSTRFWSNIRFYLYINCYLAVFSFAWLPCRRCSASLLNQVGFSSMSSCVEALLQECEQRQPTRLAFPDTFSWSL
ncbi:hypothetical protein L6452_25766 [Arctium lappa]|uniref:Uncharacterized protein n=1 Tax=Arctium lappa TaxID=4217 RepID=A0ACB9ACT4_ARCLA|nr:hypothetical protein L6452_25766 [Arctium lappa]